MAAWLWLVQGCVQAPRVPEAPDGPLWTGRLALRIDSDPPERVTANFELRGQARAGRLVLEGALGQVLLDLHWSNTGAVARTPRGESRHDSLEEAIGHHTGASMPVAALFDWLQGRAAPVPGWQVDLDRLPEGHLLARRVTPEPALELRLRLDTATDPDNARR